MSKRSTPALSRLAHSSIGGKLGVASFVLAVLSGFPVCLILVIMNDEYGHRTGASSADIDFGFALVLYFFFPALLATVIALGLGVGSLWQERPRTIAVVAVAVCIALIVAAVILRRVWLASI